MPQLRLLREFVVIRSVEGRTPSLRGKPAKDSLETKILAKAALRCPSHFGKLISVLAEGPYPGSATKTMDSSLFREHPIEIYKRNLMIS
jgi:hypothetical protein